MRITSPWQPAGGAMKEPGVGGGVQVMIRLEGELVSEIRVLGFLGFILCYTLTHINHPDNN